MARVETGWEYWVNAEAVEKDIDIANIFRCSIKKVNIDSVPGKVIACFRAPKTIQEIADDSAFAYSKYLWNELSGEAIYPVEKSIFSDIFMMLDAEEAEDLLFMYLQIEGWIIVPNSRKGDTMSFEFLAVNPKNGRVALTQVKTGSSSINKDDFAACGETVFLFQSNEIYLGDDRENIVCISRKKMIEFLRTNIIWLPQIFRTKMQLVGL